jgi:hypothetical protein
VFGSVSVSLRCSVVVLCAVLLSVCVRVLLLVVRVPCSVPAPLSFSVSPFLRFSVSPFSVLRSPCSVLVFVLVFVLVLVLFAFSVLEKKPKKKYDSCRWMFFAMFW